MCVRERVRACGAQEQANNMSDPYGDDDSDLSTDAFVNQALQARGGGKGGKGASERAREGRRQRGSEGAREGKEEGGSE